MIQRTVERFQNCDAVSEIVVVTREDLIQPITGLCRGMSKVQAVVAGGASRQESVHLGLNALSEKVKLRPSMTAPGLWLPGRLLTVSFGQPTLMALPPPPSR